MSSRPESPVDFYDPTRETLIALLKNISEEAGTPSHSMLRTPMSNSRQPSPAATLSKQLAGMLSTNPGPNERAGRSAATPLASKSGSIEELSGINRAAAVQNVPEIQITKTDSQRLPKRKSNSKESLNSMTSDESGPPPGTGTCLRYCGFTCT